MGRIINQITIGMEKRYPVPPFDLESAQTKVKAAQDAWNTRDPERVIAAYSPDTEWRNRSQFLNGRAEVRKFLEEKWKKELGYKLKKELWAFSGNKIAVRFEYEWHDHDGNWFRSYGNEMWEFDSNGYMLKRYASINDVPIAATERRI